MRSSPRRPGSASNRALVLDERIAQVVDPRLAEPLAVEIGSERIVRRLALVDLRVVDERVHAEDVLLRVLPPVAAAAGLGDRAGHLEGEVAVRVRLGVARPGAQDGALGPLGAVQHAPPGVVDALDEGELAAALVRVGEDRVSDLSRLGAEGRSGDEVDELGPPLGKSAPGRCVLGIVGCSRRLFSVGGPNAIGVVTAEMDQTVRREARASVSPAP